MLRYLLGVSLASALWHAHAQEAQDCSKPTVNHESELYRVLDTADRRYFDLFSIGICRVKSEGKRPFKSKEDEVLYFFYLARRLYWCDDGSTSQSLEATHRSRDLPKAITGVFARFCASTWDRFEKQIRLDRLRQEWQSLQTEYFCESSRYIARPAGWIDALRPSESELQKRLEQQAEKLCSDLRAGKIDHEYAEYRFSQEVLWVQDHATGEALRSAGSSLRSLFDFVSSKIK